MAKGKTLFSLAANIFNVKGSCMYGTSSASSSPLSSSPTGGGVPDLPQLTSTHCRIVNSSELIPYNAPSTSGATSSSRVQQLPPSADHVDVNAIATIDLIQSCRCHSNVPQRRRKRWFLRRNRRCCKFCRRRHYSSASAAAAGSSGVVIHTTDNSRLDEDANFVASSADAVEYAQHGLSAIDQHSNEPSALDLLGEELQRDRNQNNEIFAELENGHLEYFNRVHTQVDYQHCLVPDLASIAACPYYWGEMDRYAAETLLHKSVDGSFLLRDSAQDGYIFSVSFRRYGRSLHARIEQLDHRFSFDSHDSAIFSAASVNGLIEHYKDPVRCLFFEPMLTVPVARRQPFSLQHLCRAAICTTVCRNNYDALERLPLPKPLVDYLRYYHYKRSVSVRILKYNPMQGTPA